MSGILAGALGGLGRGLSDIAGGHIQNEQRIDLMREQQALEEQKQMRQLEWSQRIEQMKQASRSRALSEMPEDLSGSARARWLQERGLSDDAKFELDAFKADSQDQDRSERRTLQADRDAARLQAEQGKR